MTPNISKLDTDTIDALELEKYTFFDFPEGYCDDVSSYDLSELRLPYPKCAHCREVRSGSRDGLLTTLLVEQEDRTLVHVFISVKRKQKCHTRLLVQVELVAGEIYVLSQDERLTEKEDEQAWAELVLLSFYKMTNAPPSSGVEISERCIDRVVRLGGALKPKFSWKTVTVTGKTYRRSTGGCADRAPPAAHMRRGHWRNYKSGLRVWIEATQVGKFVNGFVFHDYTVKP